MNRARVLETRRDGMVVRRRHRTPDGVDYWTVEIPEPVYLSVVRRDVLDKRMRSFQRGLAVRATQAKAKVMLLAGTKPAAAAHALGITDRTAQKYRRQLKEGSKC